MMGHRIASLIWKELLAVLRDPKSRFSILMPPIIQLFLFAFAATLDVKDASIAILNRDNGQKAFELTERFRGAPTFGTITYLHSVDEIAPYIDNQKGLMVLSIDETFSRYVEAQKPATIQLIFDGRRSNSAQIVANYANTIINRYNVDLSAQMERPQQNAAISNRVWYNPNLLYYWYNIPSLVATLTMIACLIVTSQSVARERELGTFDQLLVSPLVPIEILVGKIVPGILIGMLEGCLMLVIGIFIFQIPFTGSLSLFFLSQFVFVCAISGVGLFMSSLCNTQQQAMLGTFMFMMPSVLLSGFATPIENMPTWLQPITYLIPLRYMLVICKGLFLKAMTAPIVLSNVWPMAVISLFTLVGAGRFFRRRLE